MIMQSGTDGLSSAVMLVKDAPASLIRTKIEESLREWIMDDANIPFDEASIEAMDQFTRADERFDTYSDEQLLKAVLSDPNNEGIADMDIDDVSIYTWIASLGEPR